MPDFIDPLRRFLAEVRQEAVILTLSTGQQVTGTVEIQGDGISVYPSSSGDAYPIVVRLQHVIAAEVCGGPSRVVASS